MRTSENAVWRVEEDEDERSPAPAKTPAKNPAATGEDDEDRRSSKWEKVATVATILIGFQFALLALLGL